MQHPPLINTIVESEIRRDTTLMEEENRLSPVASSDHQIYNFDDVMILTPVIQETAFCYRTDTFPHCSSNGRRSTTNFDAISGNDEVSGVMAGPEAPMAAPPVGDQAHTAAQFSTLQKSQRRGSTVTNEE